MDKLLDLTNRTYAEAKYIAKRLAAAEDYISKSPCDPDITPEQLEAYNKWQELKGRDPQTVFAGVRLD